MCSSNTFHVNLYFWVEFRKCNIKHYPTNGHSWDSLESDLHKYLNSIAFSIATGTFVEFEEKECQRCMFIALNPTEIVILIRALTE